MPEKRKSKKGMCNTCDAVIKLEPCDQCKSGYDPECCSICGSNYTVEGSNPSAALLKDN